ncbi:MAG: hypothetical protein LBR81_08225 [Prevotellaceae bacterium]|jgi:hypothetical protein|nr:hypothetical protein [Prevotellaceae bacterium]
MYYFKAFVVACYFSMGIYILVTDNVLGNHSAALKYVGGICILSYGAFRAVRYYNEYKRSKNENES